MLIFFCSSRAITNITFLLTRFWDTRVIIVRRIVHPFSATPPSTLYAPYDIVPDTRLHSLSADVSFLPAFCFFFFSYVYHVCAIGTRAMSFYFFAFFIPVLIVISLSHYVHRYVHCLECTLYSWVVIAASYRCYASSETIM